MPSNQVTSFPELAKPPIVEVVCGIVFDSFPDLDALLLGVYWDTRALEFPARSLQPALTDEIGFAFGAFPMRAVLVTPDDQFVVQLQHDRFFMNWRATGGDYPRFSEKHGRDGLLVRALAEFDKFSRFLAARLKRAPSVRHIELSKIDLLLKGQHWETLADLSEIVPVTGVFGELQHVDNREVNLRFVERGAEGQAIVHVATVMDGHVATALRIETRYISTTAAQELSGSFDAANRVLNDAFFKLVPSATERFGVKGDS